ncbi:MAG: AbrB/MazE/SpoVT family DNA-binding domain-containing protein [Chloroflexota bacterium]
MVREYSVALSSKGQLTLPAEVRRELDLERGARLRLIVRDDGAVELAKPQFPRVADLAGIGQGRGQSVPSQDSREQAYVERWRAKQERSQ